MKRFGTVLIVMLVMTLAVTQVSFGGSRALAKELEGVVAENFAKAEAKDVEGTLATMHSHSPAYDDSEAALKAIFAGPSLKYELVSFKLLGSDKEYAVARVIQKTVKKNGADYSNNVIDSIYVFREDKDAWKLWQQVLLETRIVE